MAKRTLYDILGVTPDASEDDIKHAYRKLAKKFHPDISQTPEAEKTFKEINRAYDVLSNSLKRADYDRSLKEETYVKATTAAAAAPGEVAEAAVPHAPTREEITSALSRVAAHAFTFGMLGLGLEAFLQYLFADSFSYAKLIPGLLAGVFFGIFWGADANFKIESFLGYGRLGRTYTFVRTIIEACAVGYFFALIASYFDQYSHDKITWITPAVTCLGVLAGATLGSDGDTIEKFKSDEGRFNLVYTALHGLAIGAIGGLVGILLGLILTKSGMENAVFWMGFSGLMIGIVAGSIAPPNLAAYASYVSASMRSVIISLAISVALLFGLVVGITAGPTIKDLLKALFGAIFG